MATLDRVSTTYERMSGREYDAFTRRYRAEGLAIPEFLADLASSPDDRRHLCELLGLVEEGAEPAGPPSPHLRYEDVLELLRYIPGDRLDAEITGHPRTAAGLRRYCQDRPDLTETVRNQVRRSLAGAGRFPR